MSFLGTFSALSKNGFQSISAQWILVQSIDTSVYGLTGFGQPALNATGEYLAFATVNTSTSTANVNIFYNGGSGLNWTLQQTITNISTIGFGFSLSFNDAGDYLAIGAPQETSSKGAVYIYTRTGTTWSLQQKITASDGLSNDSFGSPVSIDGNANYLIVGATGEDSSGFSNNGAVYVFLRSGSVWSQTQKVLPPTLQNNLRFGTGLQISQNGLYFVVGSPGFDIGPTLDVGRAHTYGRSGGNFILQTSISGAVSNQELGASVGINDDGSLIFIRSPGTRNMGFYTRISTTWSFLQNLSYSEYSPIIVNNNGGSAMQGNGKNLILGLFVNDRAIALDNDSGSYRVGQELYGNIPAIQDYGTGIALARSANICFIGSGQSTTSYLYYKPS